MTTTPAADSKKQVMPFIPYDEWLAENHRVLHANCMHAPQPSKTDIDVCICGLHYDRKTNSHISRYARELSIVAKVPILIADAMIAEGRYTIRSEHRYDDDEE